jgi:hypothetical protein
LKGIRIFIILSIQIFYFLGTSCSKDWQAVKSCQNTVKAMKSLTENFQITPPHLLKKDSVRTEIGFDINLYFFVLNHLSMQPDFTLDYVYYFGSGGGEPVLYARHIDQSPYLTISEYEKARGPYQFQEPSYKFMDSIHVDGTAEGFFQFIVLRIMSNQFYLWWHARYNDFWIICDTFDLQELYYAIEQPGPEQVIVPPGVKKKARDLEFAPIIELKEESVIVKIVVFTKWGGFIRESYTISRKFPHKIIKKESETLVKYDCGFFY